MKVIFVRHGESTGNAGMPTFDLATLALTDLGRLQAQTLAAAWPQCPSLIAVSPYLRTQQTAEPTMARFPDVPTRILPMQEFTYLEPSRWNGTARAERLPFIEGYWASGDPRHQDGPGAESFETLLARVAQTLDALAALPAGALVYAFSHGQFMQSLRVALLHPGWSGEALMRHFWPFNQAHPILNGDQLVVTRSHGTWHTAAP